MTGRSCIVLALVLLVTACSRTTSSSVSAVGFLGLADDEGVSEGAVDLVVDGKVLRAHVVSPVRQAEVQAYLAAKDEGRIIHQERRGQWIYWATEDQRDIRLEHAAKWVTVIERYRSLLAMD